MTDKLRIAISGSTGLIGTALVRHFEQCGHDLTLLLRQPPEGPLQHRYLLWQPEEEMLESAGLEGLDLIVNLNGANLADGRWTEKRRALLRDSRVLPTKLLANTIAGLGSPPRLFLSASATGYYGNRRADEQIDESAPRGCGFLAELTEQWEQAASPAVKAGVRTIFLRTGMVLSAEGGALSKLLPFFRLGLGGKSGNGRQVTSWVTLEELPLIIDHLVSNPGIQGPVNAVSPVPVTNREFAKTLGKVLGRPAIFAQPAWLLKLLFGEMAKQTILAGARVTPAKLLDSGYQFRYPDLQTALRETLK